MSRVAFVGVLLAVGCGYHLERDSPPPPPPTSAAEPAPPTTTAEPAPTTAEPAPTTAPITTTPVPATTTTHVPATTTATAAHDASPVCQSAFHCCQAAVAAMPIGGLVGGCGELRNADASREAYCRQAIETYRATLTQIGAAVPAACHAPH